MSFMIKKAVSESHSSDTAFFIWNEVKINRFVHKQFINYQSIFYIQLVKCE